MTGPAIVPQYEQPRLDSSPIGRRPVKVDRSVIDYQHAHGIPAYECRTCGQGYFSCVDLVAHIIETAGKPHQLTTAKEVT